MVKTYRVRITYNRFTLYFTGLDGTGHRRAARRTLRSRSFPASGAEVVSSWAGVRQCTAGRRRRLALPCKTVTAYAVQGPSGVSRGDTALGRRVVALVAWRLVRDRRTTVGHRAFLVSISCARPCQKHRANVIYLGDEDEQGSFRPIPFVENTRATVIISVSTDLRVSAGGGLKGRPHPTILSYFFWRMGTEDTVYIVKRGGLGTSNLAYGHQTSGVFRL